MQEYLVPTGDGEAEFTEKRSKFIGRIWLVETEDEALRYLKDMREKHWDATHNVYAYIIHGGQTRYSDDGEPQGTAGMPVLDVLRKRGLYNVCCVVTRYFGGTLLGAGGLLRAYSHAASLAVEAAGISCKRVWTKLDISCTYSLFERVKLELAAYEAVIEDVEYAADLLIQAFLPKVRVDELKARLTDVSSGEIIAVDMGDEYKAFPL